VDGLPPRISSATRGQDITIYEASERLGGAFSLAVQGPATILPTGSDFDAEFRCAFDLLASIPAAE
jgi:oleate hydratase